ncbi:MAG: hypothetical protein GXY55_19565 [Phycisphaerae bacterium]|nr:hypothetical protein [Phycisphaerae bacterium]
MAPKPKSPRKLGPNDLDAIGRMAEDHWRKFRPKLVAALEKDGTLYEHLKEAENRVEEMIEQGQKAGADPQAVRELALHEFILLPEGNPMEEEDLDEPDGGEATTTG